MRALSPKIKIPEAAQAKINIFCVEFQELDNAAFAFQTYYIYVYVYMYIHMWGTGGFPAK